jgi:hypothetical protein
MRPEAVIFDGKLAPSLLKQCSRQTPSLGEATWQPSWSDIDRLEAALPSALKAFPKRPNIGGESPPGHWLRQYVGIIRGGRRYIYGSFFVVFPGGEVDWRKEPYILCDGGPLFFGVDYDLAAGRFDQIAFNGVA